ncbi:acyl-CoA N-acyltransferase [Xylariales sp. AK1849]|nr:acyl-CoA N-acyltransferase [Xylariales sp. AK1849]
MDGTKRKTIAVVPATEADLQAMVKIQFAAFGRFESEQLIAGKDTPGNRALMVGKHAEHMRTNSGLVIAKADLDGNPAGFCMIYFPNTDAASEDERIPTPLRPLKAVISDDAEVVDTTDHGNLKQREKARARLTVINQEIRRSVAGRECTYLRYMCVDPESQRQGVGQALITWVCDRVDEQKVDAYLESSSAGECLYRRSGFAKIGHYEMDIGDGSMGMCSHMWRTARGQGS